MKALQDSVGAEVTRRILSESQSLLTSSPTVSNEAPTQPPLSLLDSPASFLHPSDAGTA